MTMSGPLNRESSFFSGAFCTNTICPTSSVSPGQWRQSKARLFSVWAATTFTHASACISLGLRLDGCGWISDNSELYDGHHNYVVKLELVNAIPQSDMICRGYPKWSTNFSRFLMVSSEVVLLVANNSMYLLQESRMTRTCWYLVVDITNWPKWCTCMVTNSTSAGEIGCSRPAFFLD